MKSEIPIAPRAEVRDSEEAAADSVIYPSTGHSDVVE